jgi:hypothetical protein
MISWRYQIRYGQYQECFMRKTLQILTILTVQALPDTTDLSESLLELFS